MDDDLILLMRNHKLLWLALEQRRIETLSDRWTQLESRVEALVTALAQALAQRQVEGLPITQAALLEMRLYQLLLTQLEAERQIYQRFAVAEIENGQREYEDLATNQTNEILETSGLPSQSLPPIETGRDEAGDSLAEIVLAALVWAAIIDTMSKNMLDQTRKGRSANIISRSAWDALAGGLTHVLNMMRSEQGRIYREVQRKIYQASGVVEGYYRLARQDGRTCPACLADDGTFYPIGTPMPEHRNGRCTQVPAIVGRPTPQWQKGSDWFEGLGKSAQQKILGKARFAAWQQGKFNFRDLAVVRRDAVYGDALIPAPLKDLI